MTTFGERLKAERIRLGFKQNDFAEKVGVTVQSQIRYENDKSSPDESYLAKALALEFDVVFLLSGKRTEPAGLLEGESEFIELYRKMDSQEKRDALKMVMLGFSK